MAQGPRAGPCRQGPRRRRGPLNERTSEGVRTRALRALATPDPGGKALAARRLADDWRAGQLRLEATAPPPPDRPARPPRPSLAPPADMPRRRLGGAAGRRALLHAVAHIEFNAIDLALDLVARFAARLPETLDRTQFVTDWLGVADDEARHFAMVCGRLSEIGCAYGDLPAHNGLWDAAYRTRRDVAERLAIAPMVLEARGLDVTPGMIARLETAGDDESADVLKVILSEEVGHVAAGVRWFKAVCAARGVEAGPYFRHLVGTRFAGSLKPPFNETARAEAGFEAAFYRDAA
ncbi:MAG: ferritin-like domain-containing protein [Pseudomonadota bacterium]